VDDLIDAKQLKQSLRRLLRGGELTGLPKRRADRYMLLALAAARLDPDRAYSESEVNILLGTWLASFCSTITMDHVTIRRFLVDHRFLRRDPSGRFYKVNAAIIDATIDDSAKAIHPRDVLDELELERLSRKRARADSDDPAR
jgi:hypothetical protein